MTSWSTGSTRRWRAIRAAVLVRDGYRCRAHADGWCDRVPGDHTCTGSAPLQGGHAHHTLGRRRTGDDPRHIVASCSACNLHIGDPDTRAASTTVDIPRGNRTTDPRPRPRTRWGK